MSSSFHMHPRDNPIGFRSYISILDPSKQDHRAIARKKISTCHNLDDIRTELGKLTLPLSVDDFIEAFQEDRAEGLWFTTYSARLTARQCMGGFLLSNAGTDPSPCCGNP